MEPRFSGLRCQDAKTADKDVALDKDDDEEINETSTKEDAKEKAEVKESKATEEDVKEKEKVSAKDRR